MESVRGEAQIWKLETGCAGCSDCCVIHFTLESERTAMWVANPVVGPMSAAVIFTQLWQNAFILLSWLPLIEMENCDPGRQTTKLLCITFATLTPGVIVPWSFGAPKKKSCENVMSSWLGLICHKFFLCIYCYSLLFMLICNAVKCVRHFRKKIFISKRIKQAATPLWKPSLVCHLVRTSVCSVLCLLRA